MSDGTASTDNAGTPAGSQESTQQEQTTTSTQQTADTSQSQQQERMVPQAEVDRIVQERIARERAKYADHSQLQESVQTLTGERDTIASERDALKGEKATAEIENLKLRVALSKSVPADLIDRLKGSTQEELEADAEVLLGALKPVSNSGFDGGVRTQGASIDIANESDPAKVLEWAKGL